MGLLTLIVFSYLFGFLVFAGHHATFIARWQSVAFWFGALYLFLAAPSYFAVFRLLRQRYAVRHDPPPVLLFPFAAMMLGVSPSCFMVWLWGANTLEGFLEVAKSSEGILLFSYFATAGICFGFGWWWLFHRRASE